MSINEAILESVGKLNIIQQKKLLDFINTINYQESNTFDILSFAGIMDNTSISEINKAIDNDCERIDVNEW